MSKKKGLSYREVKGLAKKIAAKADALDQAVKLRCGDLHRLLGTTDHELIAMQAEAEGYKIACTMVYEALEGVKPAKPCREVRSGGSRK